MEEKLNNLFLDIREIILDLIQRKHVDLDILSFKLGVSRKTFINNFYQRIDDYTFYLETLSLLERWEVQ